MWIIPAAMTMGHSALQGVLSEHVNSRGSVSCAAIKQSGALDGYLPDQAEQLRAGGYTVDYSTYSWSVNKQ